ncbi:uncharacterized protein FPRN_15195 [Fusarium proliferatum]|nr:uncharacterized protein FPRN_15195 [Fusarium proliferatum]
MASMQRRLGPNAVMQLFLTVLDYH